MAVKVVIERRVLPGQERRVLDLLKTLRVRCLEEGGYISGETLRDSEDAHNIIVISTWFGLMDWRRLPATCGLWSIPAHKGSTGESNK